MFIARMTRDPNDIVIFGRALGLRYVKDRDDATPEDIERRKWKVRYPHYIRVYGGEFLAGTLANGVSLNERMEEFGPDSFASTQRNQTSGAGNLDPRLAYRRRGDVELSPQGRAWLTTQLNHAFERHGQIPTADLKALDWPKVNLQVGSNGLV